MHVNTALKLLVGGGGGGGLYYSGSAVTFSRRISIYKSCKM